MCIFFKVFVYSHSEEAEWTLFQNFDKSLHRSEHQNLPVLTDDTISNMK